MKRDLQLKVQAYLDNELSPGEARKISDWISSDPEARGLYTELKQTKEIVASNEPVAKLDDSRDFYWSKIERAIATAERETPPSAARPWWLRLLAPAAGVAAIFALLVSVIDRGGQPVTLGPSVASADQALHTFEQAPDVSTITFRSEAEGVTVVWLSTQ